MSAYDKYGNLVRSRRGRDGKPSSNQRGQESEEIVEVAPVEEEEAIQAKEREQGLDEDEITAGAAKRAAQRDAHAENEARDGKPKERPGDMRPFPLNQAFRSESVLSEELREEVYRQVVGAGVDVSTVSAAFGIDLRRVAAVVRLKSIEKGWESEVSSTFPHSCISKEMCATMMIMKFSISLEDNYMVTNISLLSDLWRSTHTLLYTT